MKVELKQSFVQQYGTLMIVFGVDGLSQGDEMLLIVRVIGPLSFIPMQKGVLDISTEKKPGYISGEEET